MSTRIISRSALLMLPWLAACSSLLPDGQTSEKSAWGSYQEAEATITKVTPQRTTMDDLKLMGFDPKRDPNVATLNYSDILRRFVPGSEAMGVTLDKGVRNCFAVPAECSGIEVNVRGEHRERVGSFWPDLLNFHRDWHTTGWHFNAIILLKNGVVVYRTWGGEPNIDKTEHSHNPLGPLQDIGEHTARF